MSDIGKKIKIAGSTIVNPNIHIMKKPSNNRKSANIYQNNNIKNNNIHNNINNNNNISDNKIIQKPKPLTSNLNQRERNIILMKDSTGIQGSGLWCQAPKKKIIEEEKPYISIIPQIREETKYIFDTEKIVDKRLIENLKSQISDLSNQLNEKISKYTDAQFRAERAENLKKMSEEELKLKNEELQSYKESSIEMQQDVESLNGALNNAKKEISRLQNELNEENIKNKELNNKIAEFLINKDKYTFESNDEINKLHRIIEQLNTENERLSNILNNNNGNNNNGFNEENYKQQLRDKDKILKTMEIAMNKALNENLE